MEANWVQDSFQKNSMVIDRSYREIMNQIKNKHVAEDNLRESQLDLYNKTISKEESVFRLIVGVGDMEKKNIQIADGYVNVKGIKCTFESMTFATLKPIQLNEAESKQLKDGCEEKGDLTVEEFVFDPPIKTRFMLVKMSNGINCIAKHENNASKVVYKMNH